MQVAGTEQTQYFAKVELVASMTIGSQGISDEGPGGQQFNGELKVALLVRRLQDFAPTRPTPEVRRQHAFLEEADFWGVTRQESQLFVVDAADVMLPIGLLPVPEERAHPALPAYWIIWPPRVQSLVP